MGFFDKHQLAVSAPQGCGKCGLWRTCRSPRMPRTGEGRRGIFVLAEAPGADEDAQGVQLIGRAGRRLREELRRCGVDLDRDCWKMNAVNCRPPDNRTPTPQEVEACRPAVLRAVREAAPSVIILAGQTAVTSWWGHRYRDEDGVPALARVQGLAIPDREAGAWVCPVWHPSYVLRSEYDPVVPVLWRQDLVKAVALAGQKPVMAALPPTRARTETDPARIALFLGVLRERGGLTAIDYETSGLKPHAPGHAVRVIGVGYGQDRALAFPWHPSLLEAWRGVLTDPRVRKVAHNVAFEDTWSRAVFGVWPRGWVGDTRLESHIEDCRAGVTGLKFQAFAKFGELGWTDGLERWLRTSGGGDNARNRVEDAPLDRLMTYCAADALYTLRLARWYGVN